MNETHNFRARFDESGWSLEPRMNAATKEALAKLDTKAEDMIEQRRNIMKEKQDPDWQFSLRFEGLGRAKDHDGSDADLMNYTAVKPELGACDGSRRKGATHGCFKQLEFRREGVTETFKNLGEGIEHNYVINQRPQRQRVLSGGGESL